MSGQQISQCQECRVSTHVTCSHELQPDCSALKKNDTALTPVLSDTENKSEIDSWITFWE